MTVLVRGVWAGLFGAVVMAATLVLISPPEPSPSSPSSAQERVARASLEAAGITPRGAAVVTEPLGRRLAHSLGIAAVSIFGGLLAGGAVSLAHNTWGRWPAWVIAGAVFSAALLLALDGWSQRWGIALAGGWLAVAVSFAWQVRPSAAAMPRA